MAYEDSIDHLGVAASGSSLIPVWIKIQQVYPVSC